jgi:hypothetical protein
VRDGTQTIKTGKKRYKVETLQKNAVIPTALYAGETWSKKNKLLLKFQAANMGMYHTGQS